jgi:hypothetical protein
MRAGIDAAELDLLAETFRKTMSSASGPVLDRALGQLGWRDLLAEFPETAIPLTFRLLGETGAHAPLLNDVLLTTAGREPGGTVPLPYAGGSWVAWERTDWPSVTIDGEIPLRRLTAGQAADGPTAVGPAARDGQAALTVARHCQQVLGGIGFTAEHALHRHVKRALLLDGLLGSARELTLEAGRRVIAEGVAPRQVQL